MSFHGDGPFEHVIGKRVWKNSKTTSKFNPKPFKSTFLVNTVKGVTVNPHTGRPGFTFEEDDSIVDCRGCSIAPEIEPTKIEPNVSNHQSHQ